MKEASEAGAPLVAIVNPGSGPGTEADRPSYEWGVQALCDSGIEVRDRQNLPCQRRGRP